LYSGDSFFTLTQGQQIGLGMLSIILAFLVILIYFQIVKGRRFLSRFMLAFGFLFLFIWLSPQVYYAYYQIIFENLPVQIVIQYPPSPQELLQTLFFQESNLSGHSKAVLGWIMIAISALLKKPKHV
jgi:hypothetical protein